MIFFDPGKLFERSLEPREDGFLYYPFHRRGGYLLSRREKEQLVEERRRAFGFSGVLKLILLLLLVSLAEMVVRQVLEQPSNEGVFTSAAGAAIVFAYLLWNLSNGVRLVWHREPVAPPRTDAQNDLALRRMLGLPKYIVVASMGLVLSGWLTFLGIVITSERPIIGIPMALLFGFALLRWLQMILRALRNRSA